jgi:hypothetical protein
MLIIGHPWIAFEPFYLIKRIEDIAATPPNSRVIFSFSEANLPLCRHCAQNGISFALICDTKRDVLIAQAQMCDFIVCDKSVAIDAQKFADGYLFDAKILLYTGALSDLEWAADHEIDGILFEEGIDYGSC